MSRARDLANVADDVSTGTVVTTASPSLGRRNLIINGAMQVAQRGTSFSVSGNSYTLDRWLLTYGSSAAVTSTVTQESDTPTGSGFASSLKVETTNTVAPDANKNFGCQYSFEGQDLQMLSYGTSSAKNLTLSFWVKSSKTGTYGLQVLSNGKTRTILKSYTVDSANTWEQKTILIEGDTSSGIDNNNAQSLRVIWPLYTGPDDIYATTGWFANGAFLSVPDQVNLFDATGATWQITGVQLEVGSVASTYEHRSYGEELAACQRYYWRFAGSSGNGYAGIGSGGFINATLFNAFVPYPVEMRASPTFSIGTSLYVVTSGFPSISSINANFGNQHSGRVQFTTTSSTAGFGGSAHTSNASTSFFDADAEL